MHLAPVIMKDVKRRRIRHVIQRIRKSDHVGACHSDPAGTVIKKNGGKGGKVVTAWIADHARWRLKAWPCWRAPVEHPLPRRIGRKKYNIQVL